MKALPPPVMLRSGVDDGKPEPEVSWENLKLKQSYLQLEPWLQFPEAKNLQGLDIFNTIWIRF